MKYYLIESQGECNLLYVSRYAPKFHQTIEDKEVDRLIFSWEDDDKNEYIKGIINYILKEQITTQFDIENELELSGIYEDDYTLIVRKILKKLSFDNIMNKQYVKDLRNNRAISEKMKKILLGIIDLSLRNQVKYVRSFNYSNIDFKKIKSHEDRVRKLYIGSK